MIKNRDTLNGVFFFFFFNTNYGINVLACSHLFRPCLLLNPSQFQEDHYVMLFLLAGTLSYAISTLLIYYFVEGNHLNMLVMNHDSFTLCMSLSMQLCTS